MSKAETLIRNVEEACNSIIKSAHEQRIDDVWKHSLSLTVALTASLCSAGLLNQDFAIKLFREALLKTIAGITKTTNIIH